VNEVVSGKLTLTLGIITSCLLSTATPAYPYETVGGLTSIAVSIQLPTCRPVTASTTPMFGRHAKTSPASLALTPDGGCLVQGLRSKIVI
jgi:hypothetical protein